MRTAPSRSRWSYFWQQLRNFPAEENRERSYRDLYESLEAQEKRLTGLVARQEKLLEEFSVIRYTPPVQSNSEVSTVSPDTISGSVNAIIEKLDSFEQRIGTLEKQINRAGREQLKTGTLVETQQAQLGEALGQLKGAAIRYEAELDSLRRQSREELAAERLEMATRLFPALDGMGEALEAGRKLLAQPSPAPIARTGWFGKRENIQAQPSPGEIRLKESLKAWLEGIEFVRQRLLELLAAEGVQPIQAKGKPYDPKSQVVVEVVPAVEGYEPGTVVSEFRRGYVSDKRILRFAEVSVAQASANVDAGG